MFYSAINSRCGDIGNSVAALDAKRPRNIIAATEFADVQRPKAGIDPAAFDPGIGCAAAEGKTRGARRQV